MISRQLLLFLVFVTSRLKVQNVRVDATPPPKATLTPEEYLEQGDVLLMQDDFQEAIVAYEKGLALLTPSDSLVIALSLQTNLGTAQYTSQRLDDATNSYQAVLYAYQANKVRTDSIDHEQQQQLDEAADLKAIAASAAFYLGQVHQDRDEAHDALEAYQLAHSIDPLKG
jgi:tetratricopeptide (TPR) repeat protein